MDHSEREGGTSQTPVVAECDETHFYSQALGGKIKTFYFSFIFSVNDNHLIC